MFSLEKFYNILHDNLISKFSNNRSIYFHPFGTYDNLGLINNRSDLQEYTRLAIKSVKASAFNCCFLDQEPIDENTPIINGWSMTDKAYIGIIYTEPGPRVITIIANSEKSEYKHIQLKKQGYYNWYYFYHGFAALDWYRDFQYIRPDLFDNFNKVFICYNNYISNFRSYRLHLISNLISNDLTKFGSVSFFLRDRFGTWRQEIVNKNSLLDQRARVHIYKTLHPITEPLTIDVDVPNSAMSASVDFNQLVDAFWHIVTETVYFLPKLHLTEKTFKPIIAQRPFILVAAPGNLAYLKSYGFKTFDRWIDESYDSEQDHYLRIEKITMEIKRLCSLSPEQLKEMHREMKEILKHNYDHFYGEFKTIIVNELVDNFEGVLMQINNGRHPNNHSNYHQRFELDKNYLDEVKQRLLK